MPENANNNVENQMPNRELAKLSMTGMSNRYRNEFTQVSGKRKCNTGNIPQVVVKLERVDSFDHEQIKTAKIKSAIDELVYQRDQAQKQLYATKNNCDLRIQRKNAVYKRQIEFLQNKLRQTEEGNLELCNIANSLLKEQNSTEIDNAKYSQCIRGRVNELKCTN